MWPSSHSLEPAIVRPCLSHAGPEGELELWQQLDLPGDSWGRRSPGLVAASWDEELGPWAESRQGTSSRATLQTKLQRNHRK